MSGIENTLQEIGSEYRKGYDAIKSYLPGDDKKKEKQSIVGNTAKQVVEVGTQQQTSMLKQGINTVPQIAKQENVVENSTSKTSITKQSVTEIERIFKEEVFETGTFKESNGIFASIFSGDKVKNAKEMQTVVTENLTTAKQILDGVKNDVDLQKNPELKTFYTDALTKIEKNKTELVGKFPGVYEKLTAQLNIINGAIYSNTGTDLAPVVANNTQDTTTGKGGTSTSDIEKKTVGILSKLGLDKDSWITKGIVGVLGFLGVFKVGSWFSDVLDFISEPFEKLKKKMSDIWQSPLKWAEGKWNEATSWVKGIFGIDEVPLGSIGNDGKSYKNDNLKLSINNKTINLDGKKYEFSIGGKSTPSVSFEKGDSTTGDYIIINKQKIPVIALKKRIEGDQDNSSSIVFAENFENNQGLILNKA